MATVTARAFNHDVSAAKRSAVAEPVIITDRGKPSHVLLSIEQYQRLVTGQRSIVEWLSTDDDIEFAPERLEMSLQKPDL